MVVTLRERRDHVVTVTHRFGETVTVDNLLLERFEIFSKDEITVYGKLCDFIQLMRGMNTEKIKVYATLGENEILFGCYYLDSNPEIDFKNEEFKITLKANYIRKKNNFTNMWEYVPQYYIEG